MGQNNYCQTLKPSQTYNCIKEVLQISLLNTNSNSLLKRNKASINSNNANMGSNVRD